MGKTFIISAILAASISAPLLCSAGNQASVSTEVYPEQMLVAPVGSEMRSKIVPDSPDVLALDPGQYSFWIPQVHSDYTCFIRGTVAGDKAYNLVVKKDEKDKTCSIEVKEIK